ncbi:MAG: hypothetical protein WCI47_01440 [bacterium]
MRHLHLPNEGKQLTDEFDRDFNFCQLDDGTWAGGIALDHDLFTGLCAIARSIGTTPQELIGSGIEAIMFAANSEFRSATIVLPPSPN